MLQHIQARGSAQDGKLLLHIPCPSCCQNRCRHVLQKMLSDSTAIADHRFDQNAFELAEEASSGGAPSESDSISLGSFIFILCVSSHRFFHLRIHTSPYLSVSFR
jgi:hypothetical protein